MSDCCDARSRRPDLKTRHTEIVSSLGTSSSFFTETLLTPGDEMIRFTNSNAFGDVFFVSVLVMDNSDENALTFDLDVVVTPTTFDVVGDEALKVLSSGGWNPLRAPALMDRIGCFDREAVFFGSVALALVLNRSLS
ncbi:hypothetical protein OGAPHI_005161 [Ogataea philodendri]|uniref:Uncharacterized protein n=1 Tax=Ogataea philodendri TaxID=1378263 RepID=A0A9P8P297_9ASCO|nr:uncharacterized protein OGAPHI_005161 [Ogataea philodendri]KAH3663759.1 hypothetical protein OGAPHI_005161 [Ogataea philodendri]